jgi:hypothetical protein
VCLRAPIHQQQQNGTDDILQAEQRGAALQAAERLRRPSDTIFGRVLLPKDLFHFLSAFV